MKQIQIKVKNDENFTATSLMWRYAKENNLQFCYTDYRNYLFIDGEYYSYDHWEITPCEDAPEYDTVTLYLMKKEN